MPKEIIINGRFLSQSITGVQRYALELVKMFDKMLECKQIAIDKYSFVLMTPPSIKFELKLRHITLRKVGHLKGHLWEQIELPFYSKGHLLLNFCNAAPLLKFKQLVTIHDAAVFGFPRSYSFAFRTWYKFLLTGLGIVAKKIITDSWFSKKELMKYCGIHEKKICVIYLGKEHVSVEPDDNTLQKYKLVSKQFVLAVSSVNPNKNFQSIVKAVELLQNKKYGIVIVGGANPKVFRNINTSLPENVQYLGYINDAELMTLYAHAGCFVYPSFYEGFGLPPIEAMACGCPVIVSETASLPEVCGDAAIYCNPNDPLDISRKIALVMEDRSLQTELRAKGLQHAEKFSWAKTAREVFRVVEEVLWD